MNASSPSDPMFHANRLKNSLIFICVLSTINCYVDRVSIAVAIIPLSEELQLSFTTQGVVLSSFFIGYMLTQLFGGWLSDRFGGGRVLVVGVLVWTVFTLLTPAAGYLSLAALIAVRIGMGLGEGVNFPAIHALFARWVPKHQMSRAVALNSSGISLGTLIALIVTPIIVTELGWEWCFYIFGAVGIAWYLLWIAMGIGPKIDRAERERLNAEGAANSPTAKTIVPWMGLLKAPAVWAIVINHFCVTWIFYIFISWLPSYLSFEHDIQMGQLGYFSMMPYIALFLTMNMAGWAADFVINRGVSIIMVRKALQVFGLGGASLFLTITPFVASAGALSSIITLSVAMAFLGFTFGAFMVNIIDVAPKYSGSVLGLSNTIATIPGIIGVTLTGYIVEVTDSWNLVFYISAALGVFGTVVWLLTAEGKPLKIGEQVS